MKHQQATDEIQELASLYALGALLPVEATTFEGHLAGCETCAAEVKAMTAVVAQLGFAAPSTRPRPEVRDRLLAGIRHLAGEEARQGERRRGRTHVSQAAWTIVRSTDSMWESGSVDGLLVKRLFLDPLTQRSLILARLEGGARYPDHWHADTEELYLLGGDLAVADQVLRQGDYCAAPAGTRQSSLYSQAGCTFLLFTSERQITAEENPVAMPLADMVFVRAGESDWRDGGVPGVHLRLLFSEPVQRTMTALIRMQPGAALPRHQHVMDEQFYMLAGDGHVQGQVLYAGDYYRAAAGTIHDVTYTEGGCVFLLLASRIEILA